jgi:anti-sigma factor RsiW
MKHPESQRLSALLDGDLSSLEARELKNHLDRCEACSALLQNLAAVKDMAAHLPARTPARDLWPGISEAIQRGGRDPDIIHLHGHLPSSQPPARRAFLLSLPQAAAAGLVLALVSGTVGARLGHRGAPTAEEGVADAPWVSMVVEAAPALEGTAREVAQLESALVTHRERLDSLTVEVLERNLAAIDRAIQESVAALEADPGNRFLMENIERAVAARADYLRDATQILTPRT